jgi:hypothetical protein
LPQYAQTPGTAGSAKALHMKYLFYRINSGFWVHWLYIRHNIEAMLAAREFELRELDRRRKLVA